MAKSIVELTVEDGGFNQKLKNAAGAMKRFGDSLASAASDGLAKFSTGLQSAKQAQIALNNAVKANLYALAATAAIEVGKALYDWATGAYEAETAQKKLNAEIESTKLAIDNMTADIDFDIRIAKAAGKSVDEILKMRKAAAQARLELADANYDKITALGSKATKEQIAEATSMQEAAWKNMRKVLEDMTINDVQKRNATGPYKTKTTGGSYSASRPSSIDYAPDSIAAQQALVAELTKKWQNAGAAVRDGYKKELKDAQNTLANMIEGRNFLTPDLSTIKGTPLLGPKQEDLNKMVSQLKLPRPEDKQLKVAYADKELSNISSGIGSMVGSLEQLGVEIPEGLSQVVSGIQAVTTILSAITTIVTAIQAIQTADLIIPSWLARGGIVHAASGYFVPGNSYSGDRVPALLNSGELVLNKAQQGNLASQLEGGALGNLRLTATISGEQIRLALNNNGRRTGRGEMITAKFGG